MRGLVLVGILGCGGATVPAQPPQISVQRFIGQRGATRLFVGEHLVVGSKVHAGEPGTVSISNLDGSGLIERPGWALGIAKDRAIIADRDGGALRILAMALGVEPVELARLPLPGEDTRVVGAVTGDGHIAVITNQLALLDAAGKPVASAAVNAWIIAGDPHGSAFVLYGSNGVQLVDGATGAVRWSHPQDAVSELAFVRGRIAGWMGDAPVGFDLATGARARLFEGATGRPRNVAFAPSGQALAWSHDIHPDHMLGTTSHGCRVFVVKAGARQETAAELPDSCYDGIGMAFVGDELWLAPP